MMATGKQPFVIGLISEEVKDGSPLEVSMTF